MAHVLLLEPNTLLGQAYTQALTREGHQVRHVLDAQTAVHAADEQRPDVVVLELQLPAHNGIEFLHEFRSYADWRMVPAIVNTALHPVRLQASKHAMRVELGVTRILYKPTATLADICRAVREQTAGAL